MSPDRHPLGPYLPPRVSEGAADDRRRAGAHGTRQTPEELVTAVIRLTTAVAFVAVGLAAFAVALTLILHPAPAHPAAVKPAPPGGLCVKMLDYSDAGMTAVESIQQAQMRNGILTCEVGAYVPVTPR